MTLINILIMDDGDVKMAVPEGSFAVGSAALKDLILDINFADIPLVPDGNVEQHKHSAEDELVHQAAHSKHIAHTH